MSGEIKKAIEEIQQAQAGSKDISILGKLGGRKFLMAIVGVVAIALQSKYHLDPEVIYGIGGIIITFILGQSYSEAKTGGATSSTTPVSSPAEVSRIDQATELIRHETAIVNAQATVAAAAASTASGPAETADKVSAALEAFKNPS